MDTGFKLKSKLASAMLPFSSPFSLCKCLRFLQILHCVALSCDWRGLLPMLERSWGKSSSGWIHLNISQFRENKLLSGASDDIRWSANSSWLSTNSPAGYHLRNEVRRMTFFGWPKYWSASSVTRWKLFHYTIFLYTIDIFSVTTYGP